MVLKLAQWKLMVAEQWLAPVLNLIIRLYMAKIFFVSGQLKLGCELFKPETWGNCGTGWESTLTLFEYEYQVPVLPMEVAAFMGTAGELILPILLVLGFGGRFAAAGLLVMTAVIQFTVYQHDQHWFWMMLLAVPLLYGPGKLSADYFIRRKFLG